MSRIGHLSGDYIPYGAPVALNVMSGIGHITGLASEKGAASAYGTVVNAKEPLMCCS